jgi:hypothetical protein
MAEGGWMVREYMNIDEVVAMLTVRTCQWQTIEFED